MALTRRKFLAGLSAAGASPIIIGRSNPVVAKPSGDKTSTLQFAAAGTVTSSWDPTSHTVAPQIEAEGFYFSRLTDCPMTRDNPTEVRPDLATSWELIDEYVLEYKLRKGVTFHNGKEFSARDVKATYEYACQPQHPLRPGIPGWSMLRSSTSIPSGYTPRNTAIQP